MVVLATMTWMADRRFANSTIARTLPALDRFVHRLTRGRYTVFSALLPTLMLVTTGRKTGLARRSPLLYLDGGDGSMVVIASNFGREHHSAWSANLLATPEATVIINGRQLPVRAELLDGADRDAMFDGFCRLWSTYADYAARSGRRLRVFRLVPTGGRAGRAGPPTRSERLSWW